MEMFLTVNETLKGKTLMFKYPNLLTPIKIIDDSKFLRMLRGKVISIDSRVKEDSFKVLNRKNYPKNNPSDFILKSMLGDDYKVQLKDFLVSNLVLNELVKKNPEWSVQQTVNGYYDITENMGAIDKNNCILGLTSSYLTTLVHSISYQGFFEFEIEDKTFFGFKCHTLKENSQIDIEHIFRIDEQKNSFSKKIESFCIFMTVKSSNNHEIQKYKHALEFASKLLMKLEETFRFLTNRYYSKFESNTIIGKFDELDCQSKKLKIVEVIYSNYIKRVKSDDLANLMTQMYLCFLNEFEFEFRGLKVNLHELMNYKSLQHKLTPDEIVCNPEKTLLIYDKQHIIKKCQNTRFRDIIKHITPFKNLRSIQKDLAFPADEIKFYVRHLLYHEKAQLMDPISDYSLLIPSDDYTILKNAFEIKNNDFFRKFNRNLCDIMIIFFEKKKVSYLDCKKFFLRDNISPADIVIELLYEGLISIVNPSIDKMPIYRKLSDSHPLITQKGFRS